jgi:hypothetical protein
MPGHGERLRLAGAAADDAWTESVSAVRRGYGSRPVNSESGAGLAMP